LKKRSNNTLNASSTASASVHSVSWGGRCGIAVSLVLILGAEKRSGSSLNCGDNQPVEFPVRPV
jgi:hypothetical protein